MSKDVEKHLSLNVSLPSGSKKRSRKSRSSKRKESEHTQKPVEIETPQIPAQVAAPEYDVEEAQEVVFKPNEGPQTTFLSSSEREV